MPLRDVIMDDDDTPEECRRRVIGLMSATKVISQFPVRELSYHFDSLRLVRDRLSDLMDKVGSK